MKNIPCSFSFVSGTARHGLAAAAFCWLAAVSAQAQPATENLVANGDFETPSADGAWAANWSKAKGGQSSWVAEEGDHFIRLQSTEPGKMVMLYHQVGLRGARAVELTVKARVTGLARGAQTWFDARIMTSFRDVNAVEIKGSGAKIIAFGKDTGGWVERKVVMNVPAEATFLAIMPTLLNVDAGTLELSSVVLRAVEPEAAAVPAK